MICPECKAGYRVGFTECSDCHIPLIEHLVESAPVEIEHAADIESVVVFRTKDFLEAGLVKSLLEGSGVEVFQVERFRPMASGRYELSVLSEQEELAQSILK